MSEPRAVARAVSRIASPDLREVTIILLSMGLLIFGTFISLISHHRVGDFIGNHMGGLGVVGLFASLAAHLAMKKGRTYKITFLVASLLPIFLGALVVLAVFILKGFIYCGGGVALASAIIILIVSACLGKRSHARDHESIADSSPTGSAATPSY